MQTLKKIETALQLSSYNNLPKIKSLSKILKTQPEHITLSILSLLLLITCSTRPGQRALLLVLTFLYPAFKSLQSLRKDQKNNEKKLNQKIEKKLNQKIDKKFKEKIGKELNQKIDKEFDGKKWLIYWCVFGFFYSLYDLFYFFLGFLPIFDLCVTIGMVLLYSSFSEGYLKVYFLVRPVFVFVSRLLDGYFMI